jgi:co-chaperonin GroES (HSP10)
MICPACKSNTANKERIQSIIKDKKIPFVCPKCGMIKFPVRATLDRLLVWADPIADTLGKAGLIYLPEVAKENYRNEYGTVLSCGPGYYDAKQQNRFIPTSLKVGDRIAYDKDVLYRLSVVDDAGKKHQVTLMGHEDVYGCAE